MKRFFWLAVVAVLFAILPGCGDVFRPIIIPNPPVFPNPAAAHTIVTVSDNGDVTSGSAMVIDVSGDSISSIKSVAVHPVHMVQRTATEVLALNQAVTGLAPPPSGCLVESNGTVYNVCPSLSRMIFNGTIIGTIVTITLPASSAASFVAVAPNDTKAYVTLPANNAVAVISINSNAVSNTIAVGNDPEALAVTPDTTKLYVANYGDGTLSAFNTVGFSARTICDPTGKICPPTLSAPPIWLSARSDSQRVYVLEQSGTLAWLDTHLSAGPDTLTETAISVPGAATMIYDSVLNRLYIPGGNEVAVVDVSQSAPQLLAGGAPILIPTVPPTSRASGDPCAATTPGPLSVVAAAALPDGHRAYIGSFYVDDLDNVCPQVTVITTSNNSIKTAAPVPGFPDATNQNLNPTYYVPACAATRDFVGPTGRGFRFNLAAAGDSSRAYLASCDGGNINFIDTSTDTYFLSAPAPASVRPPILPSEQNPPQNPVFMLAGP